MIFMLIFLVWFVFSGSLLQGALWVVMVSAVFQLTWKSSRLVLILLILEALVLLTLMAWSYLYSSGFLSERVLLMFLMASVSEACVALAALIGFVRETGSEYLTQ